MFTATKSALNAALALTGDIVERRNTIPILSNVLFARAAEGGGLVVRMTDLDIEAEVSLPATVQPGFVAYTVPGHMLRDIARKLPEGEVDLSALPSGEVQIRAGRSKFALHSLPEADFPSLSAGEVQFRFSIDAKSLAAAIAGVAFATSTEETRYYLNGIYLHAEDDGVRLVATDGHRLASRHVRRDSGEAPAAGIIVPRKTVAVLQKILPKDGLVEIEASDAKIAFRIPGLRLISKLIDGTFPDYRRVIPADGQHRWQIESAALTAAVDRVATISGERGKACRFSFSAGQLMLSVVNADAGAAEETLACEGADELTIGFNAKYVADALNHLPEGDISLTTSDPGSPAVLRADGDHAANLIVLMPMRV